MDESCLTQYDCIVDSIEEGGNVFLHGPGGTGKTFTIAKLVEHFGNGRALACTALTGVAAANLKDELDKKRLLEEQRIEIESAKLREELSEIGSLTEYIKITIKKEKHRSELEEKQKTQDIKDEAKEFRKSIGNLLLLKQDLIAEMARVKEEEIQKQVEIQKAKEREGMDDLAKLIKEAAKKSKNK